MHIYQPRVRAGEIRAKCRGDLYEITVQTDFAGVPFRRGQFRRSPVSPESGFAGVSFAGVRFRRGPVSPGYFV